MATEFGISVPTLRQLCMDQFIPLPGPGDRLGKDAQARKPVLKKEQLTDFNFAAAIEAATSSLHYPGETAISYQIPKLLTHPDPLIIRAQRTITTDYQLNNFKDMIRTGLGELTVRASKKNMDRALRIMDTLVKVGRARGYEIIYTRKGNLS